MFRQERQRMGIHGLDFEGAGEWTAGGGLRDQLLSLPLPYHVDDNTSTNLLKGPRLSTALRQ